MWFVKLAAFLAMLADNLSAFGRHEARNGLLQMPPSFAHDGINLYPANHPNHNRDDMDHLVPELSKQLYYSQEGHRPALHGAKHAQLNTTFSGPSVVLEHSSFVKDVICTDKSIATCFNSPQALTTVEKSWKTAIDSETFNLRSIFRASQPLIFHGDCVTVNTELLDEQEAIQAGELTWGTYINPTLAKRQPVRGHVRVIRPDLESTPDDTTVDLTTDPVALNNFFALDNDDATVLPDYYEYGLNTLSDEEYAQLGKRGLFSWIINGIKKVVRAVSNAFATLVQVVETVAKIVIAVATVTVKLLMVPFGVPFEQSYGADISFDNKVRGSSYSGALAFSISKGITQAEVTFINHEAFEFDAIFGVTIHARAFKNPKDKKGTKTTIEKELATVPFGAFVIRKIITLGPQVAINAAASVYADAVGSITAGARFSIAPGEVVANAMVPSKNIAWGFTPSLEPKFELNNLSIIATADLALPIGIELAIDVLDNTWKKSIGVFFAPSLYFTAGFSNGEKHACNNGIELRVGAKKRVYTSALGIWEYEFKGLGETFYETGLGCLSTSGWNGSQVENTTTFNNSFFNAVAEQFGGAQNLASSKTVNLTKPGPIIYEDERFEGEHQSLNPNTLRKLPNTQGFRLVQDAELTATMVSGTNGKIYMVNNSANYDISSPWGALDLKKNIFSYDVFGRLINYQKDCISYAFGIRTLVHVGMCEMAVTHAENMSSTAIAAELSIIEDDKDTKTYGVVMNTKEQQKEKEPPNIFVPTVCQTPDGLRLYATSFTVDAKGVAKPLPKALQIKHATMQEVYKQLRLKNNLSKNRKSCRTVRLTSDLKSVVQGV